MKNVLKNNSSKFVLIGKIKGMAVESRRARARMLKRLKQKDKPVWHLAMRKIVVGKDIRHHLLAYAFLRGDAYYTLEKTCREDNKPSAVKILDIIKSTTLYKIELAEVEQWLNGEQV